MRTHKWLKMGVELEGAWDKDPRTVAKDVKGAAGKGDQSVHGLPGQMGEITTFPHDDLGMLLEDIKKLHPVYTNFSAGLHIHASFSDLDLTMLTSEDFWRYFKKRWQEWGERWEGKMSREEKAQFWDRYHCRSENAKRYCKDQFMPGQQLTAFAHDDRYTQLNFVSYKKFKTLECRLLPAFQNPEITVAAIEELSEIYDTFLHTYTFPGLSTKTELTQEADYLVDEERLETPDISYKEDCWVTTFEPLPDEPDVVYCIEGAMDLMKPWVTDAGSSM